MRPECACAIALAVMTVALAIALSIVDDQPRYSAQLRNAYWPYSVETSVHDR